MQKKLQKTLKIAKKINKKVLKKYRKAKTGFEMQNFRRTATFLLNCIAMCTSISSKQNINAHSQTYEHLSLLLQVDTKEDFNLKVI